LDPSFMEDNGQPVDFERLLMTLRVLLLTDTNPGPASSSALRGRCMRGCGLCLCPAAVTCELVCVRHVTDACCHCPPCFFFARG
jgi:hypothetical protein